MSKFVLFITGVSGAGKTEALKCLEDLGYDCIDNMPLRLIPSLLADEDALPERLVLAVDGRNCDISTHQEEALESIEKLNIDKKIVFMEAESDELIRRYKETRRRHPGCDGQDIRHAIASEREALKAFKEMADVSLDTTEFKPKQLWQYMRKRYEMSGHNSLQVYVMSFGFKHAMPREADYVFDVRFLKNPYWDKSLRNRTGLEEDVRAFVKSDEKFEAAADSIENLLQMPLENFKDTDRASVTIAIGCTGGQHRSVTTAIELGERLSQMYNVHVYHKDVK